MESQMKMRSISVVVSLVLFSMLAGTPAIADTIGVAVGEVDSKSRVGNPTGETIDFYIPLTDGESGTYGVDAGTAADKCYPGDNTCKGGLLEMILYFGNVVSGEAVISLLFTDLDLLPDMNDTSYFWETLVVMNAAGKVVFDQSVSGDKNSQLIEVEVDVSSTDFWVKLVLGTGFDLEGTDFYKLTNTQEHLIASLSSKGPVSSVPEPGTLALLGLGLVGMGASRRRVRK